MATYTANYAMIKPSYADVADVAAINQNTDTIDEIMHGSQTSIADAYDPAETYAAGDLAMHDFQLYKCNTDDTTGTWDPTKWERTTAAAEGGGGGGSAVSITPTLSTGTKIADFEIDGVPGELYAPTGGGGGGSSEIYDNIERVVGTYFGETLYQKTIPNISITGTNTTVQTGVNIGSLVAIEANGYKIDRGGNIIRFKESYNDGGDTLDVEGINNDIRIICSSWFIGSTIDITIKYTKATT